MTANGERSAAEAEGQPVLLLHVNYTDRPDTVPNRLPNGRWPFTWHVVDPGEVYEMWSNNDCPLPGSALGAAPGAVEGRLIWRKS